MRNWIQPHKSKRRYWKNADDLHDWAFITDVFKVKNDYDCAAGMLACKIKHDGDNSFSYMGSGSSTPRAIELPVDLSDRIIGRYLLVGSVAYQR